jgi:hypothetical protein
LRASVQKTGWHSDREWYNVPDAAEPLSSSRSRNSVTASLKFDNLPLVEVALRTSFRSQVPLRFATLNDVRSALAEEFLSLDELPQIEAAPGINMELALGVGQIPGAVLSGHKQGVRATIQQHVVVTRWVRDPHRGAPPYPHFDLLRECHWRVVHALLDAARTPDVPCGAVNMSYTNFLQWEATPDVLSNYFDSKAHVQLVKKAARLHKYEVSWQDVDAVDLRLQLERVAFQIGDEKKEGYNLTTVAGKAATSLAEARENLNRVHDLLQGFFDGLISADAKREWGYHA